MTSLEIYVHPSARRRDGDTNLRLGVERTLSEYADRVTHGVVRLERLDAIPERYTCCIDLGVRWWGRLHVEVKLAVDVRHGRLEAGEAHLGHHLAEAVHEDHPVEAALKLGGQPCQ